MALLCLALILEALVVIGGTFTLGWWVQRNFDGHWSTWAWGGVAFVAAQIVHIPVLLGLTYLGRKYPPGYGLAAWLNIVILGGTAGVFENLSRYIFLRGPAKSARRWKDGVMFGAGHGGVEAILLIAAGVITAAVMLTMGDKLVAQFQSTEQSAAVAQQLAPFAG